MSDDLTEEEEAAIVAAALRYADKAVLAQMVADLGRPDFTGLLAAVEAPSTEDLQANIRAAYKLLPPADQPRASVLQVGSSAHAALREHGAAQPRVRFLHPLEAMFGLPIVESASLEPNAWRVLDQHGNEMRAGQIG